MSKQKARARVRTCFRPFCTFCLIEFLIAEDFTNARVENLLNFGGTKFLLEIRPNDVTGRVGRFARMRGDVHVCYLEKPAKKESFRIGVRKRDVGQICANVNRNYTGAWRA